LKKSYFLVFFMIHLSVLCEISLIQFVIPGFDQESSVFLYSCFRRNVALCRN
jgi:hypothetical protein